MGVILFWIHDASPGRARTRRLVEGSVELVAKLVTLASLPLMRPLRRTTLRLVADLREEALRAGGSGMKVVIPGGTGQVGKVLSRAFQAAGHEVVVLTRKPGSEARGTVRWDGETLGAWAEELDGAEVVINLAGRSVDCRYHAENRRLIIESREKSTRLVGAAIARASRPPRVWLQASTATIYAHRYDAPNDETTGVLGGVGARRAGHLALQHRRGKGMGAGADRRGDARTRAKCSCARR